MTGEQLVNAARMVALAHNELAAIQTAIAGEIDARSTNKPSEESLARQYGCKNATEMLQRATGASSRTVRSRIRLSAALQPGMTLTGEPLPPLCPEVAEAFVQGTISEESATHIVQLVRSCPTAHPTDLEAAEVALINAATGNVEADPQCTTPLHADSISIMCRAWKQALDPDGAVPSEEEILRRRGLRLSATRDGLVSIRGQLLPEVAAALGRSFDAISNPKASTQDAPADECTPDQKRHDMFASIVSKAMASPDMPTLGAAPVTVLIQVKEENLTGNQGIGWLHGYDGSLSPVSMETVRHAAQTGSTQRVTQAPNGKILGIESPERIFTPNQRKAIFLRDGGCVIPGCTVPASWCEIHHVLPHSKGGKTHTSNGAALCFQHHRSIETSGWKITMLDGVPQVEPPPWLRQPPSYPQVA